MLEFKLLPNKEVDLEKEKSMFSVLRGQNSKTIFEQNFFNSNFNSKARNEKFNSVGFRKAFDLK